MIAENSLIEVGRIIKPHGYKGEMSVDFSYETEYFKNPDIPFFLKIDNIPVPFFVETLNGRQKYKGFLKLEGIDSDKEAVRFSNREIYVQKATLASLIGVDQSQLEEETEADRLVGFDVILQDTGQLLGKVEGFEEGVEYDYLVVKKLNEDDTFTIPFIEEFIDDIVEFENTPQGEVVVNLPDGFLDI